MRSLNDETQASKSPINNGLKRISSDQYVRGQAFLGGLKT
jgi:hypothetical protein